MAKEKTEQTEVVETTKTLADEMLEKEMAKVKANKEENEE